MIKFRVVYDFTMIFSLVQNTKPPALFQFDWTLFYSLCLYWYNLDGFVEVFF